jgi:hypothetical protein
MNVAEFPLYTLFGDRERWGYTVYQWLQCHTKRNLQHACCRISIIYPIWGDYNEVVVVVCTLSCSATSPILPCTHVRHSGIKIEWP